MRLYFSRHNFAIHRTGEYNLRAPGARRLISYADPSKQAIIDYWAAPLVVPTPPKRRPQYVLPRAEEGLV